MDLSRRLSSIVNHVFLPPKLPQEDDSDLGTDKELLRECEIALRSYQTGGDWRWAACSNMVRVMLKNMARSRDLSAEGIEISLQEMTEKDILAFHIRGQNAGLIIRRLPAQFSFESFELSPTTDSVMQTKGRLERYFPGPAIAVDSDTMFDPSFRAALADLLSRLDVNTPDESWPSVVKAESKAPEIRDTIHPRLITEMLTGILRGIGQPIDVTRVYKRTRDDALWDNVFKPWRRSPLWLLLRVGLQTTLMEEEDDGHRRYKSFMILFMARILNRALQESLPDHVLFIMAAKISRRTLKLGVADPGLDMQYVERIIKDTHRVIGNRWRAIEQNPDPLGVQQAWKSSRLSFAEDTKLAILNLRPYLASIQNRVDQHSDTTEFEPQLPLRVNLHSTELPHLNCLSPNSDYATRLALRDIEVWIRDSLDSWLSARLSSSDSYTNLTRLIREYIVLAFPTYAGNAENTSVMLLTTVELWVALDKCVILQEPLLAKYEPGFPPSLFDPLLLPAKLQMKRLAQAEKYIQQRVRNSSYKALYMFHHVNTSKSFNVQYFEQSLSHQELRRRIEAAATTERNEKEEELSEKRQEHTRLMQESNSIAHTNVTRWNRRLECEYNVHDKACCQKCQLKDQADRLEITVHEWPLPYRELETKSAVFELGVPRAINEWRNTTYALLVDIYSPKGPISSLECKTYTFTDISGLKEYASSIKSRLRFASEAKPFVVSHYRNKTIPQATEDNICVNNGLQYAMHDTARNLWTKDLLGRCDVQEACTFQLPPGAYETLQYSLNTTTHTSNEVLAKQSECPRDLSLHEFYAFATLRSGHRLQWRNLARELVAQTLNFSREETCLLVLQAAWQAGCRRDGGTDRESHTDLDEEEFGNSLLVVLEEALNAVEGNWQGAAALRTFLALATRLLSVSPHTTVHEGCYEYLRRARTVALQWTRDVGDLLHEEQDAEQLNTLNLRALEIALTCHGTFDVDHVHLPKLMWSSEDIATIIECCIIIHDRCPAMIQQLPRSLEMLLWRYERLSHSLETDLHRLILQDRAGIDKTIRRVWSAYRPGCSWTALNKPNERWLTSKTSNGGGFMTFHYNILDGSLLVNGSPLTRLPRTYELHETYQRIFGKKVFEVGPSTMDGMVFQTRTEICGLQVHFQMQNSELIIRTRNQQQICELLPIRALHNDFPAAFVQDFAHWLDLSTDVVEWRPLTSLWTTSSENWQMLIDDCQAPVLSRRSEKLVDIRSPTAKIISQLLSPLEHATHIHTILGCENGALDIHLPRMKLNFHLSHPQGLLESKQFRGMVVDEKQSFGAFTGLINKLVLREVDGPSRCVIVPHGEVTFSRQDHHVRAKILTPCATYVKYHLYQIDGQLGQLVDNGNLQSRLFRLYLHATTSHCLKDELTERTGTEEALSGLASAATRSFVKLDTIDLELLEKLAQLTPHRQFYPQHLRVMQQVKWSQLPPLSQHCGFSLQVASILRHARSLQVLEEHPLQIPSLEVRGDQFLLERAAVRDASFQVHDFGGDAFTTSHDKTYNARDHGRDPTREVQTCRTAKLVNDWSTHLTVCPRLLAKIELWKQPIQGCSLDDDLMVGFDLEWFEEPSIIFPKYWCALQEFLSHSEVARDKYKILVLLSTLSYSIYADQKIVQTLLALATVPALRMIRPPRHSMFQLADGYQPAEQRLESLVTGRARPFYECPESDLPELHGEKKHFADARRSRLYKAAKDEQVRLFVGDLIAQWPTANISTPTDTQYNTYISIRKAVNDSDPCFKSWHRNVQFQTFIQNIQVILDELSPQEDSLHHYSYPLPVDTYTAKRANVSFIELTRSPAPRLSTADEEEFDGWVVRGLKGNTDRSKIKELLDQVFRQASTAHEERYARDLVDSFVALQEENEIQLRKPLDSTALLKAHLMRAKGYVEYNYLMICGNLQAGLPDLVQNAQMLPCLSPTSILSYLANDKITQLSDDWKASLVQYGLSITTLQRAERLVAAAATGAEAELLSELENPGHQSWDPMQYTDWLLLEIENDILIRPDQAQIAHEMMLPSSGSNSVMQLNMGQGKSSVIVPLLATSLANRRQLVRVVVLKPLAMQMFQLLARKLGGMLNRRVYYMPISRSVMLDVHRAQQIFDMYRDCMKTGGILLIQPEHILSFELMGLERLHSGDQELGQVMTEAQDWLCAHSRDILDESDEILSVRFELIYTLGTQRAIEFSPERWSIIQQVLGHIGTAATRVMERFPHGLEVIPAKPGGFPRIRILQSLAGDELLESVAQQLCGDGLRGLPTWSLSREAKAALHRFLTDPTMGMTETLELQKSHFSSHSAWSCLLVLKGLFSCGILKFTLGQKRWRVNYGHDSSRTLLAVPYHAKDSPASRAEFSHPDATIVLTCLAYYYCGLSDQQISASFEALLKSDRAKEEYEYWVKDAPEMPAKFKHLTGINLSNMGQCSREVFPPLRFSKAIIDFFTSAIVFSAEMKEFPHKLSSSGWDIAREKPHPTTGFSGTNDSRYVLPLSISQSDLPAQRSTNAAVLDCLLRPENSFVDISQYSETGCLNAEILLKMIPKLQPQIRVILDVGAQVLELRNEEVAREWLSSVPASEAQAAIFVDTQNEIRVISRDGTKELLQMSPYAKQMDQCLVYLDESHTRGTDLKLPADYRAIVTLGPGLTKDRLVQACMRMRKLGKGQAVVFCCSMEVQRKILACSGRSEGSIDVADVLRWSIAETYASTKRSIPLWATQGIRHQKRRALCSESPITTELVGALLEPEAQSLEQRYGAGVMQQEDWALPTVTNQTSGTRGKRMQKIRAQCEEFEVVSLDAATLQEEQERELSPEKEREQQVEYPPVVMPHPHSIHPAVRRLITEGVLDQSSDAFRPAFEAFRNTTAGDHFESTPWPYELLATTDFTKTIQSGAHEKMDLFLRPVQWVVSFSFESRIRFAILSPYEANELLPSIRQYRYATLHSYSPRLSMTARTLEHLSFFAIPPVPESWSVPPIVMQLNLFAGQLYIRSYEEYESLCSFLGLCSYYPGTHVPAAPDGFINPANRSRLDSALQACPFNTSPVAFLRAIIALRRKGQSFAFSHLGKISNGELITKDLFVERAEEGERKGPYA